MRGNDVVLITVAVITAAAAFAARRMLVSVHVIGDSMEPTLHDGDRILVRRRRPAELRRGDIAVLRPPDLPAVPGFSSPAWHVKRVAALPGERAPRIPKLDDEQCVPGGTVVMLGDNPVGGDSRNWGPYPAAGLLGTYLCRTSTSRPC